MMGRWERTQTPFAHPGLVLSAAPFLSQQERLELVLSLVCNRWRQESPSLRRWHFWCFLHDDTERNDFLFMFTLNMIIVGPQSRLARYRQQRYSKAKWNRFKWNYSAEKKNNNTVSTHTYIKKKKVRQKTQKEYSILFYLTRNSIKCKFLYWQETKWVTKEYTGTFQNGGILTF